MLSLPPGSRYACRTKASASTSRARSRSSSTMSRWARTEPRPPPRSSLIVLGQRRLFAQPHPGRARQGVRLLPVETLLGLFAGRGDAGRTRPGLGRRTPASAVARQPQRQAVRAAGRGRRHEFRFPRSHRPCGPDEAIGRGHDHRVRHRLQQGGGRRSGPPGRPRAGSAIPASPSCGWSRPWLAACQKRRSCASATRCASR